MTLPHMLWIKAFAPDYTKQRKVITMYKDDDTMTPRDRISDEMLSRILGGSALQNTQRVPVEHASPLPRMENGGNGGCNTHSLWGLAEHPLASVYAPLQQFRDLYDRDTALSKGTIFSELDLPFMGRSVAKGGCCND